MPERIQRKRTKGWRMPEGAVYVGRPTRWGNPYRVETGDGNGFFGFDRARGSSRFLTSPVEAVSQFRAFCRGDVDLEPLRGKDLVCWCPLDQPCHADVLLEWANTQPVAATGEPSA